MNVYELVFPGIDAAEVRGVIRWELFLHPDVRDVLVSPQHDTLLVLHRGAADPEGWSATLAAAGLPVPAQWPRPTGAVVGDRVA